MKEGFIKNPVPEFAQGIKKRIKANSGYCLNKPKGSKDNKCPCKEFKDLGVCECGLYIRDPNYIDDDGGMVFNEAYD